MRKRAIEAYDLVGRELSWDILGIPVHERDLAELRADPGELRDERWLSIAWKKPEKECVPCWWLVNAADADKTKQPAFACRSLVCLTLELNQNKCADPSRRRTAIRSAKR